MHWLLWPITAGDLMLPSSTNTTFEYGFPYYRKIREFAPVAVPPWYIRPKLDPDPGFN